MKWLKLKRRQPVEMTEEERIAHEKYVAELNEKNKKTVRVVCVILWCVIMAALVVLLVLDVNNHVSPAKILFHGVATAIVAVLALPRVIDFVAVRWRKPKR